MRRDAVYSYADMRNNYTLILRNFMGQSLQEKITIPHGSYGLVQYCEDTATCRRSHIMRYYGIHPQTDYRCDNCDVCCQTAHMYDVVIDASRVASRAINHAEKKGDNEYWTVDMLGTEISKSLAKDPDITRDSEFLVDKSNCKRVIIRLILMHFLERYNTGL